MTKHAIFVAAIAAAALLICGGCDSSGEAPSPVGSWIVEDIDNGGVLDSARLEVNFGEDGRVSGVAACNNFSGPFTHEADKIYIGPLISTKKMCPPALMDMETKMLLRLEAVEQAMMTADGALELSGGGGRLLLRRSDP